MTKSKSRDRIKERRKKQQKQNLIKYTLIAVVSITIFGYIGWVMFRPAAGEQLAIEGSDHLEDGDPVIYNSNPPTSGDHYGSPMPEGFYYPDTAEVTDLPYPVGYLLHSLEHGYTIFWYNCDNLASQDCDTLLSEIQSVMDDNSGNKLIAWPWPELEGNIAMTSWGQVQHFDEFDILVAQSFIDTNRMRAPEPNAP